MIYAVVLAFMCFNYLIISHFIIIIVITVKSNTTLGHPTVKGDNVGCANSYLLANPKWELRRFVNQGMSFITRILVHLICL